MTKILNLYAGIGGNRKLWEGDIEVTAVELNPEIAAIYQESFPKDKVIVGDAHKYLIEHYKEFDFIWSSPPCPTHSRLNNAKKNKSYPDMRLYEEIIFLKHWFKGKFCIENVIPYYDSLIKADVILGRHQFWTNISIEKKEFKTIDISRNNKEKLSAHLDMPLPKKNARLLLRNCLNPKIGEYIFKSI